jgi:hypothetical protein
MNEVRVTVVLKYSELMDALLIGGDMPVAEVKAEEIRVGPLGEIPYKRAQLTRLM